MFFHIQNNSIFTQFKFFLFLMSWHPFVLPRFLPRLLKCAGLSTELKGSWVSITLLKICQRSSLRCYLTNPTPVMEISMPFTSYLDHILDILMYQRMWEPKSQTAKQISNQVSDRLTAWKCTVEATGIIGILSTLEKTIGFRVYKYSKILYYI